MQPSPRPSFTMRPVHTVERDSTPGHMSSAFLLCKPHCSRNSTMDNRRDGGAGKAVVTVKAMGNIPVGRLESQGWERLKPGGLGSEVLSSQGGRDKQALWGS